MRPGIAAALAMAALSASAFAQPARAQVVDERTRLRTKPIRREDTTRRYIVQTPEQRAWNEAIDARNAAKKAKKLRARLKKMITPDGSELIHAGGTDTAGGTAEVTFQDEVDQA